jgi:AmmeMemoRadiSam system protein A
MSINLLSDEEKKILLILARHTIDCVVNGKPTPQIDIAAFTLTLRENGASFVTLTKNGNLRGCIGTLEAYQPLVQDVCEHAAGSALEDYRFPPVQPKEVSLLKIEISYLNKPKPVVYERSEDLLEIIKPGVDGVILRDGTHRATFLPQVWQKIPLKEDFLSQLCLKMGVTSDLWRRKTLQVYTYNVEEFSEN